MPFWERFFFYRGSSGLRGGFEGSVFHRREGEISKGVLVTIFREVPGEEPKVAFWRVSFLGAGVSS